jgi:hypothetical protein
VTFVVLLSLVPRPLLGSAIVCAVHCEILERLRKIRNLGDSTKSLNVFVHRASNYFAVEVVRLE